MSRASDIARRLGERRQRAVIASVRATLAAAFPELDVTAASDGVVLAGKRLAMRAVTDPRLRWIRGLLR
ncbi:MAG: hypothetical protein ACKVOB_04105 [Sphingomonas sp.]